MSFKYSAFIEKSQEAREWLESIGYKIAPESLLNGDWIFTYNTGNYWIYPKRLDYYDDSSSHLNCKDNIPLFKAITAMRDDGLEYMMWYINNHTGQWRKCDIRMMEDENIDWGDWSEASFDELINHFKK